MLEYLQAAVMLALVALVLSASIRLALRDFVRPWKLTLWSALVSGQGWCLLILVFLPAGWVQMMQKRGSPIPWVAMLNEGRLNGTLSGLFAFLLVVVTELWLLWIPARLWIARYRPTLDVRHKIMAHTINILAGVLLMIPRNPVYRLLMFVADNWVYMGEGD